MKARVTGTTTTGRVLVEGKDGVEYHVRPPRDGSLERGQRIRIETNPYAGGRSARLVTKGKKS